MADIYPFRAVRPRAELAAKVSSLPYDVMNREEAAQMAAGNPFSFLRISRAEIDFPRGMDPYAPEIYSRARANLDQLCRDGVLFQDPRPCLYVYRQTMNGREQYGLVCCMRAEDYFSGIIKKHELTRADKEEDRLRHVLATNCHSGPVFLAYRDQGQFSLFGAVANRKPEYDFVSEDGIGHTVWSISDEGEVESICKAFVDIPSVYIADGHHRSAAGARSAKAREAGNPSHTGGEEYSRYLTILFPAEQLRILDYNRILKDWNGMDSASLLSRLSQVFQIHPIAAASSPEKPLTVHLYMQKQWYTCEFLPQLVDHSDPVKSLDVSLLQELVLGPLFGIDDPRTSKRIDFVGGIRGLGELERRVDAGDGVCAFAMHPTGLDQLMAIADVGKIMPPKSTWFEPKLRDGLLLHMLD